MDHHGHIALTDFGLSKENVTDVCATEYDVPQRATTAYSHLNSGVQLTTHNLLWNCRIHCPRTPQGPEIWSLS